LFPIGSVLELSALGCSSTHNTTLKVFQRAFVPAPPKPGPGVGMLIDKQQIDITEFHLKTCTYTFCVKMYSMEHLNNNYNAIFLYFSASYQIFTGLKPFGSIVPNWVRAGVICSRLFKYTQHHTEGFSESICTRTS
jgi:hypothetical protein